MAITSIGYDGSVDEQAWVKLSTYAGRRYGVLDLNHWRVLATGTNRDIGIDAGVGYGLGITDSSTWESLSLPTVASGSKWFLIVARRNWSTNTTSFAYIEGGATFAFPTRNQDPGALDDHPFAMVRVDGNGSGGIIGYIEDLRIWQGDGGAYAKSTAVLGMANWKIGTQFRIGNDVWQLGINASGIAEWTVVQNKPSRLWTGTRSTTAFWTGVGNMVGVTVPAGAGPLGLYRVHARAQVSVPGAGITTGHNVAKQLTVNGGALGPYESADIMGGLTQERSQEEYYNLTSSVALNFDFRIISESSATMHVESARITVAYIGPS